MYIVGHYRQIVCQPFLEEINKVDWLYKNKVGW